jgi:hypothetical protein
MAETKESVKTYNHDVAGLCTRMHRFIVEGKKCVSSGMAQVSTFDQERLATYLNAIDGYADWVVSQPQLDLPETHPRELVVPLMPDDDVENIENESLRDVCRLWKLAILELASSQSSRSSSGLVKFDEARLRAIVGKSRALLENYIKTIDPLDLPESSPAYAMSGPGKTGV